MIESVIKTLYLSPRYNTTEHTGRIEKIRDDALFYVIAGSDGTRKMKILPKPKYTFYVANEDMKYHRLSCPIEKLNPVTCDYSQRHKEMAKSVNLESEFMFAKQDYKTKQDWINRNLHGNSQLYFADMNIEDVYRLNFNEKYGEHSSDIEYNTSFTDIEVRADMGEWEQHKAEVPICSICHLDSKTETIHVLVLNDKKVPMVEETFKDLHNFVGMMREYFETIRKEAQDNIKKDGGNPDSIHKFNFKFKFYLFETEADLIKGYFDVVKETSPDFCACWGINFDMITIKNRAARNGLNMADLVSENTIPPEFRYFEYVEDPDRFDVRSATHYSRYFDKIFTTSKTQWYCQMSMHSNLRKRFQETNYKLDTIGERYAYIKKVDLKDEGYSIKDVYSKNFKVFLKYAIMDVVVQFMIERVNSDIPRYMVSCKDSRFTHGIRKTIGIKNELAIFLKESKGEIVGNNKIYDIKEAVPGAIIASPNNIARKGISIMGVDTHIYRNCVDLDLTAEYPSIMIAYNILKTTIFGRIINIYHERNLGKGMIVNIPISDGATFNSMLETIDTSIFDVGQKYFGLPSVDDILAEIEKSCIK